MVGMGWNHLEPLGIHSNLRLQIGSRAASDRGLVAVCTYLSWTRPKHRLVDLTNRLEPKTEANRHSSLKVPRVDFESVPRF